MENFPTLSNEIWNSTVLALHGVNINAPKVPQAPSVLDEESQQIRSVLFHRQRNGVNTRSRTELG